MTTRLRGPDTHFLPFNRGSHPGEVQCGAGNPLHPSGYRTGYFWEDVLQRDSFLDILGHFMFVETGCLYNSGTVAHCLTPSLSTLLRWAARRRARNRLASTATR